LAIFNNNSKEQQQNPFCSVIITTKRLVKSLSWTVILYQKNKNENWANEALNLSESVINKGKEWNSMAMG
jgi:hypothetical protein